MDSIITVIQTLGFPIACVLGCSLFIYKLVTRHQDEARERENRLDELIVAHVEAQDRITETIKESNEINKELSQTNKELSETNRTLVNEMEHKLIEINDNVNTILTKLD